MEVFALFIKLKCSKVVSFNLSLSLFCLSSIKVGPYNKIELLTYVQTSSSDTLLQILFKKVCFNTSFLIKTVEFSVLRLELYEINFTKHLLDSVLPGGRVAIIVPISTMTGKTKDEKAIKEQILKQHTLEGVITLNKDTFYGVGTHPVIAIFTAGRPHPESKVCKFINFENDGFKVAPHIGLIETESAKDRKEHFYFIDTLLELNKYDRYDNVAETTDDFKRALYCYAVIHKPCPES